MSAPESPPITTFDAFRSGFAATWTSVFTYVLFGTYIGIGALAHDFGFSLLWSLLCTLLVWAGPAQVILISSLAISSLSFNSANLIFSKSLFLKKTFCNFFMGS